MYEQKLKMYSGKVKVHIHIYLCTRENDVYMYKYINHTVNTYISTYLMTNVNMAARERTYQTQRDMKRRRGSRSVVNILSPTLIVNFEIRFGHWSPTLPNIHN